MTALNYPPRTFQNCANCHYCLPEGDNQWTCRRRAPAVPAMDPDALTVWPLVQGRSWCGEWTPLNDVDD
jgi:hypothetical protein